MAKKFTLTEFEWAIMSIIWENPEISVRDVRQNLPDKFQKAYTTIQTYMERLVDKGFLSKKKIGRVNFYTPEIDKETVQKKETVNFINKTFQGSPSKLAAFLFDSNNLAEDDLEKLKKMINEEDQK
jgi:BlaI family penicillinase repressor